MNIVMFLLDTEVSKQRALAFELKDDWKTTLKTETPGDIKRLMSPKPFVYSPG